MRYLFACMLAAGLVWAQNTPIFPGAVATPAQVGIAANGVQTTLAIGIGATGGLTPCDHSYERERCYSTWE